MTSPINTLFINKQSARILSIALVVSSVCLSVFVPAQAANSQRSAQATYQTYVIHTFGGSALLPAVRQQLSTSADGGSASLYQDKLVLNTTARNYHNIQQLLSQIDRQPQALTVSVRVGNNSSNQSHINQGRVIINNRGIQGSGSISQNSIQQQNNSIYQVQTLSGSAARISTGTLYSLIQHNSIPTYQNRSYQNNAYSNNRYPHTTRPSGQIIIQQQLLLPTIQGIQVLPRVLANGQVEVQLSQVEEQRSTLNNHTSSTYRSNPRPLIDRQALETRIIVPRGQWVAIGKISQNIQHNQSSFGSSSTINSSNDVPIWLLVQ